MGIFLEKAQGLYDWFNPKLSRSPQNLVEFSFSFLKDGSFEDFKDIPLPIRVVHFVAGEFLVYAMEGPSLRSQKYFDVFTSP